MEPSSLSEQSIASLCAPTTQATIQRWICLPEVDSTNTHLAQAMKEKPVPTVCVADRQTQGKGRLGRVWESPAHQGVYCSIGLPRPSDSQALQGLTLVVGIAVHKALNAQGIPGTQLKWPNDIWLESKKLGGILVEVIGSTLVIGIGLNIAFEQLPEHATDLKSFWHEQAATKRAPLIAAILDCLLVELETFYTKGLHAYQSIWESLDALQGKHVTVTQNNTAQSGQVLGISSTGALRLQTPEGEVLCQAGDATLGDLG